MSSTLELEKTEENIAKLDLGESKPKRKYVKKVKVVEVDLTPPVVAEEKSTEPKPKRERSDAQKLAFEKCLESKRVKAAERKSQREEITEEKILKAEEKIIKHGVKLQKKKLIELALEDGDGADEIPDSVVKAVLKKRASKKQPANEVKPSHQAQTPPQSPSRRFTFVDN